MTMNSCTSTELSACWPPLTMFIIGAGSRLAPTPPRYRYSGWSVYWAAALATASETPRIALAPSSFLLGVPSSSIMRLVDCRLGQAVHADQAIGDLRVDVLDGLEHALAQVDVDLSPSRSSQASWTPVLAPLGTAARPNEPSLRRHFHLDGRIAAAVQNLPAVNGCNNAHLISSHVRVRDTSR